MLCCVCVSKRELNQSPYTWHAHEISATAPRGWPSRLSPGHQPSRKEAKKMASRRTEVGVLAPSPGLTLLPVLAQGQLSRNNLWASSPLPAPPDTRTPTSWGPSSPLLPLTPVSIKHRGRWKGEAESPGSGFPSALYEAMFMTLHDQPSTYAEIHLGAGTRCRKEASLRWSRPSLQEPWTVNSWRN